MSLCSVVWVNDDADVSCQTGNAENALKVTRVETKSVASVCCFRHVVRRLQPVEVDHLRYSYTPSIQYQH